MPDVLGHGFGVEQRDAAIEPLQLAAENLRHAGRVSNRAGDHHDLRRVALRDGI